MHTDINRDDIAFLRRVSEEARYAPLLGGRYLVLWGSIVAIAYGVQFLVLSDQFGLPPVTILVAWAIVMSVGGVGTVLLHQRMKGQAYAQTVGRQIEAYIWSGTGCGIGAVAFGVFMAVYAFGKAPILFDTIVAVALMGYGVAFSVVRHVARVPWLRWPAIGSFLGAGLVPVFAGEPLLYLVSAIVVIGVAIVPGVILWRQEPLKTHDRNTDEEDAF